jgi:hypothetical protein
MIIKNAPSGAPKLGSADARRVQQQQKVAASNSTPVAAAVKVRWKFAIFFALIPDPRIFSGDYVSPCAVRMIVVVTAAAFGAIGGDFFVAAEEE